MTDQSYQKARQLMDDAYKAGYEGKPEDTIGVSHPSLELQYLRGANHAKNGDAGRSAAATIQVLETAVKVMTVALDNLVGACMSDAGQPKQPDKRDLMKARSMLPAYCKNTLTKQSGSVLEESKLGACKSTSEYP